MINETDVHLSSFFLSCYGKQVSVKFLSARGAIFLCDLSLDVKEPSRVTKKYCAVAFHKKDTPASALTPGAGEYLRSRIPITPGFSSSFLIL